MPTDVGELPGREGGSRGIGHRDGRGLAAEHRDRDHIDLVVDLGHGQVPFGRHPDLARPVRARGARCRLATDLQVRALVRTVPLERNEALAGARSIEPVRLILHEMDATPAVGSDAHGFSAGCQNPDQVRGRTARLGAEIDGGRHGGHDPVVVQGPHRILVDPVFRGQANRSPSAVDLLLPQGTIVAIPGGPDHPFAICRKRGLRFDGSRFRQSARLPVRPGHDVDLVEGRENEGRSIRRHGRIADFADREGLGILDGIREGQFGADGQVYIGLERDGLLGRPIDRYPPEGAAVEGNQRLAVRREGHAGHDVPGRTSLLIVPLDRIGQPALFVGVQVPQDQPCLVLMPGGVDQPVAVGRERGAHAGAVARGAAEGLTGLPIVDQQLHLRQHGVVLPLTLPDGVPDVPTICAEGGAEGVFGWGASDDGLAGATVEMGHPDGR